MRKILISIAYICLLISTVQAQITLIPDPYFESKLISLGVDSDGAINGQILSSDAAAVTYLDIGNSNNQGWITDLIGIDSFVNLVYLSCSGNQITSLSLNNLPLLRKLRVTSNQLTTLNLSSTVNLDTLWASNNLITTIDLSSCVNLVELRFTGNLITTLDLSNNVNLEYIYCYSNELDSIEFSTHPNLTFMSCWGNNLNTIDFSGMPNLYSLYCHDNKITEFDLSNVPNLRTFYCQDNRLPEIDLSFSTYLDYFNCSDNLLSSLDFAGASNISELSCKNNYFNTLDVTGIFTLYNFDSRGNSPGLRICVNDIVAAQNAPNWDKDPAASYTLSCALPNVEGQVSVDTNSNCVVDSLEQGLSSCIIEWKDSVSSQVYYTITNPNGAYSVGLPMGTYYTKITTPNIYWVPCLDSQIVHILSSGSVSSSDWAINDVINCPYVTVDISAPFLRMTGGGSSYSVSYCNNGTLPASNVYVEVNLDPALNFISSSIPFSAQVGNVYTFNIGALPMGDCGSFYIQVVVDTSAQFQQTHCTEAHIFPDSFCVPVWSGPIVDGSAVCNIDTISFFIDNIGSAMLGPHQYTIIEDDIAMRVGTIQLGAGQSTVIEQEVRLSKTYRIEIEQAVGFPPILGDPVFSIAVEGCNPLSNGSFNTGFITQFPNGNSSPFIAVDCQQNVASYDPNDKAAQPEGYGVQHYIEKNSPIDYKIRFQNTGTDTAFNIIIIDTLSAYLDLTSLQMGASSHAHTWEIIDSNTLKVTFANVVLVDSNANEALSHGFFRYRINQKTNNSLGSLIENQAAIYFDYNPPIFTNTTFHTIGENFVPLVLTIEDIYEESIEVTAFPNPFNYSTTIKVEGKEYGELELSVFDITGRMMTKRQSTSSNQIQLSRGNLQAGIYFYELKGDGKLLNTGKLLVQ
jgi:hypothetical protein